IARLLGVSESTVRYHLARQAAGASDRRADQPQRAAGVAEAITQYVESVGAGPVNLAELHDYLVNEHGYQGSLRSVQRYWKRNLPKPRIRARRRVETPPGAQAQADWAEWPRVRIAGQQVYAYQFHMRLSHSRYGVTVWSPRKDQLAWHDVHNGAFRRIGGVAASVRIDNERTAVSCGAGPWGELNPSYRRYARAVRFHIDPCLPRSPRHKAKVERGIRTERGWHQVLSRDWESWEELQAWSDERTALEAQRRICPATGTSVAEAWEAEKRFLTPVPLLPEPFDIAVTRVVADDCTVCFEGRRYSVPFRLVRRRVDVHGCARLVQVWFDGEVVCQHPRAGRERIVLDPQHYEGESTDDVIAPTPLGRMGKALAEIAAMAPQQRSVDLYAKLAAVAR
ncbi:MAG TPA: IS21 family transposase, partial [Candidatus Limnocylindrales bacterium]|nr:IS21 family transposase [Candidatus Limnocylindrales bacterium]